MTTDVAEQLTQFLTFKLGGEVFAVDVSQAQEVLEVTTITRVPKTPEFMTGVINLRGRVVPVVDLRLKFGMEKAERTIDTCIIVMEVYLDEEKVVLGTLVDSVQEVVDQEPGQIEPPPRIGTNLNTDFIRGMGKRDDHFMIILDINKIFSVEEITIVKKTERTVPGGNAAEIEQAATR
ncbi:Chemotaxis protein CheW [subsurface metagenome]